LIELADRFVGGETARTAELKELQKLKAEQEAQLAKEQKKVDNKIFKVGHIYNANVRDVRDLTAAIAETNNEILKAEIALQDFLVGGITENTLADAITQGFEDGKLAVDDFAGYMNDVLKNGAIEIFKVDLLNSPEMVAYKNYIDAAWANDGVIDAAEKAEIDRRAAAMAEMYKPRWDALTGSLGMGADRNGSSKGFASMTQDSADELNGRFTTMQGHTFSINEGVKILTANSRMILKHLAGIETNTGRLEAIQSDMGAVKLGIDTINLKGITIKK